MQLMLSIVAIIAVGLFLIFFVSALNRKKSENDIKNVINVLSENKSSVRTLFYEQKIIEKLNLPEDKVKIFVYAERALIILLIILSYMILGVVGLGIFAAVVILVMMDNKLKEQIYESGVTRINEVVAFMDYFTPAVSSGQSAKQAFMGYIQKLDPESNQRKLLIEYWNHKNENDYSYETPESIRDITSVYENALYNEEKGVDDYLYIIEEAKADLFQKSVYYNDFNSRVNEVVKPISWAYYIGVPIIIIMLFGMVGDFWFTFVGAVVMVLLVILFFSFKYLMNKLTINSLHQIL